MVKEEEEEGSEDEEGNGDSDIGGGGETDGEEEYAGKEENSYLSYPETALINKVQYIIMYVY